MTVFTNGAISLTTDLIFGVCVLGVEGDDEEASWIPITEMSPEDMKLVQRLLDFAPACPDNIKAAVYSKG